MPPLNYSARINLHDLRAKFLKVLGPKKDAQYFKIFTRFLGQKVSKSVLDRQVLSILGRENLGLHNHFVKAIYVNATCGIAPTPATLVHTISRPVKGIRRKPIAINIEPSIQGISSTVQGEQVNKDVLTLSPKNGQSDIQDRKAIDERQSLVDSEPAISLEVQVDAGTADTWANGRLDALDLCRASHQSQDPAEQPDSLGNNSAVTSSTNNVQVCNRLDPTMWINEGDMGRVEPERNTQDAEVDEEPIAWAKSLIEAPLGMPFCAGSTGGARGLPIMKKLRTLQHTLLGNRIDAELFEESNLPDEDTTQARMEQIAIEGGLQRVSSECGNLLNSALDIHLRRLLAACTEFVKSRCTSDIDKRPLFKQTNGDSVPAEIASKLTNRHWSPISLFDFGVTMDLNPRLLGENWPTILEKIALQRFEQDSFCNLRGFL
ncbi:hypothetical protein O6H91_15G089500 [Diphasiastrum complanatum]|uniref:Uncharacterized protein n=2 Tax=Diphasiastrum complanatum TaxID=34168 RepID=A0ACC2BKM2_DIPCM|nr:hypothetical protein O6H91_15G089500 [Diphasiastrum complanatum]KAJ7530325.1 hypothetical protein O6H91_15G089500 [Diphasiastrum complanatum]